METRLRSVHGPGTASYLVGYKQIACRRLAHCVPSKAKGPTTYQRATLVRVGALRRELARHSFVVVPARTMFGPRPLLLAPLISLRVIECSPERFRLGLVLDVEVVVLGLGG